MCVIYHPDTCLFSFFLSALLLGLLAVDVQERMTISDICQHPWVKQ